MGFRYPFICPKFIDVVTDSGAQSCLWSRKEFLASGFSMKDLIPVRHAMRAANRAPITIDGAVLLRLSGSSVEGSDFEAAAMVYISPDARSFFLSKDAMIQLGVIAPTFPQIGSVPAHGPQVAQVSVHDVDEATELSNPEEDDSDVASCGCLHCRLPQGNQMNCLSSPPLKMLNK